MGFFRSKEISKGWKLEQWSEHTHSYCLTIPQGDNLFAIIKYFLSTLPGASGKLITNDVFEGTEVFFTSTLKFKDVVDSISEKFGFERKESKRKYRGGRAKKPVDQFTTDWVYIRSWDGVIDAAKELNGNIGSMSAAAKGKQLLDGTVSHYSYGYNWKYK